MQALNLLAAAEQTSTPTHVALARQDSKTANVPTGVTGCGQEHGVQWPLKPAWVSTHLYGAGSYGGGFKSDPCPSRITAGDYERHHRNLMQHQMP